MATALCSHFLSSHTHFVSRHCVSLLFNGGVVKKSMQPGFLLYPNLLNLLELVEYEVTLTCRLNFDEAGVRDKL